jgi:hypothetical protein
VPAACNNKDESFVSNLSARDPNARKTGFALDEPSVHFVSVSNLTRRILGRPGRTDARLLLNQATPKKRRLVVLFRLFRSTLIVFGIAFAVPFYAQQTAESSWQELQRLKPGQAIEVIDRKLKAIKGSFLDVSESGISVKGSKGVVVVPRDEVVRVGSRGGRRRNNALKGAIIGALAGLAVGAWADYHDDVDSTDPGSNNGKIGASFFGAGVGAAVGTAFPGYRTIYRIRPNGR